MHCTKQEPSERRPAILNGIFRYRIPSRGFKALKQLVKVLYKAKRYDEMMEAYQ